MKRLRTILKTSARHLYFAARDTLRNQRYATAPRRFLIVQHSRNMGAYDLLLDWVRERYPPLRGLFEMRLLPCRVRDWSQFILHTAWVKDPLELWSPDGYAHAMQLLSECDARGIPVINRVDRLSNAGKSTGARLMAAAGLRTPRISRIDNVEDFKETLNGLSLPIILREDWGHGKQMVRIDDRAKLRDFSLAGFLRPLAVEYVDVQSADGLYRKYRYVAIGDECIPLHMHATRDWVTRGTPCISGAAHAAEEAAFINGPAVHHEQFQRGRESLGLDFVAFDFSYDRDGQMIVWEANPFPLIHFPHPGGERVYREPGVHRTLSAMLKLYLERARLPVPDRLGEDCGAAPACAGK